MSYTHLAGRLIEVQRSMLGQPAITIAQSIDGLHVSPDGNVSNIDGDEREIIATLFERYTEMLGDPAENRLRTAAVEFEDELELPAGLCAADATQETTDTDESSTSDDSGAEADGDDQIDDATSIEIQSPDGAEDSPDPATVEPALESAASADGDTPTEPIRKEYTLQQSSEPVPGDEPDLENVYLLREEGGWHVPISVEEAIVDAVTGQAGLGDDELDCIGEYAETGEIVSVLGSETETVASFEVGTAVVVVHPSGTIAVQQK